MTDAPTGSNADEWALFLSEWGTAYCAVRIADRIEALEAENRRLEAKANALVGDKINLRSELMATQAKLAEYESDQGEMPTVAYWMGVEDGKKSREPSNADWQLVESVVVKDLEAKLAKALALPVSDVAWLAKALAQN